MNSTPKSQIRRDFDFSSPERQILDRAPCKAGKKSRVSGNYYIDTSDYEQRMSIYRNVEPLPFKI